MTNFTKKMQENMNRYPCIQGKLEIFLQPMYIEVCEIA